MEFAQVDPVLHSTPLDTLLLRIQHGLVQIALRCSEGAGHGEGTRNVGRVHMVFATGINQNHLRDVRLIAHNRDRSTHVILIQCTVVLGIMYN